MDVVLPSRGSNCTIALHIFYMAAVISAMDSSNTAGSSYITGWKMCTLVRHVSFVVWPHPHFVVQLPVTVWVEAKQILEAANICRILGISMGPVTVTAGRGLRVRLLSTLLPASGKHYWG